MSETERLETLKIIQQENVTHSSQAHPVAEIKKKAVKRVKKERSAEEAKYNDKGEQIYCICRKPDNGEWMIGCDFCDDWFHGECVKMDEVKAQLVVKFACPRCQEKGHLSQWKPKCRLPSCEFPADVSIKSKYCTPQHGIMFFQAQLRDTSGITREQLAKLVRSSPSLNAFKDLGSKMPFVPQEDVIRHTDPAILGRIQQRQQDLQDTSKSLESLKKYIKLCKDRAKRISEDLAKGTNVKKRDTCGYDYKLQRIDIDNEAVLFIEQHANDESLPNSDEVCLVEKRKCLKHNGWQSILTEEVEMRDTRIQEELAALEEELESVYQHERLRILKQR
jgi:COMPASS component SPP1